MWLNKSTIKRPIIQTTNFKTPAREENNGNAHGVLKMDYHTIISHQTASCSKMPTSRINGRSSADVGYVIAVSALAIPGRSAEIKLNEIALHVEILIIQSSDASQNKEPNLPMKTNDKLALNVSTTFRGTCYSLIRLAARAL